jgi:predicted transcriptional regulator
MNEAEMNAIQATNAKIEKSWSAVLVAARTHHKNLVDAGLSKRQAAKELGVSQTTVLRDLKQNVSKNETKCFTKKRVAEEHEPAHVIEARETFETIVIDPPWRR